LRGHADGGDMPKQEDAKSIVLHPMTFEETLARMLKTPPVNPAKRKKRRRKAKAESSK
jgi:hypothetical protein